MSLTGNRRIVWQKGPWVVYADITVEIDRDVARNGTVCEFGSVGEPWRAGVAFGIALAQGALAGVVDFNRTVVRVTAFRGQPVDTTVVAVAFVTFHAVAMALSHAEIAPVFTFDESSGRFSICHGVGPDVSG